MLDTVQTKTFDDILDHVSQEVGERVFETWFKRARLLALYRGTLRVGVPSRFHRDWILETYGEVLRAAALEVVGVEIVVNQEVLANAGNQAPAEALPEEESPSGSRPVPPSLGTEVNLEELDPDLFGDHEM